MINTPPSDRDRARDIGILGLTTIVAAALLYAAGVSAHITIPLGACGAVVTITAIVVPAVISRRRTPADTQAAEDLVLILGDARHGRVTKTPDGRIVVTVGGWLEQDITDLLDTTDRRHLWTTRIGKAGLVYVTPTPAGDTLLDRQPQEV